MLKRWHLWNFFGSAYLTRLYWLVRNLLPWGNTVQFALIFPARMDHNSVLPPTEETITKAAESRTWAPCHSTHYCCRFRL
ncbi:hypothetical protein V1273_003571 [Bradyrhizobium sp. AZCC 1721]